MYTENQYISKKIVFLNILLTLLIVILHAAPPQRFGLPLDLNYPFIYCTWIFCQISVPMFFFISAFLFYRFCSFRDLKRKLKSRLFSLMIPYFIWNVLFVCIYYILTHIPFIANKLNMGSVLNTPLSILIAIIDSKYTPLWFIKNLMIFSLLSPLILLIFRKLINAITLLFVVVVSALIGDYEYESIFMWFPVYLQGALLGYFYNQNDNFVWISFFSKSRNKIILIFLFLFFLSIWDSLFLKFFRLFSSVLVWICVDLILYYYLNFRFKVKEWMKYTFFIYCTHYFFLNVEQKLIVIFFKPTSLVLNFTFILTPIVTILLLVRIASYLSRFKFYKYMSGGR